MEKGKLVVIKKTTCHDGYAQMPKKRLKKKKEKGGKKKKIIPSKT